MKSNTLLFSCFLLIGSCSNKKQNGESDNKLLIGQEETTKKNSPEIIRPVKEGFHCNDFSYDVSEKYCVDQEGYPLLTEEESISLMNYAKKNGQIKNKSFEKETYRFLYLLPRLRNQINTHLYDSIINSDDQINFNGLDKWQMNDLINSDAVILGEITDKRFIRDTIKCYFFKTEYKIKVNEVLHSYFKLNENSVVLIKDINGFVGGCDLKFANSFDNTDHVMQFRVGDKWIFFLKHNEYYSKFFLLKEWKKSNLNYQDVYCPQAFSMYSGNSLFNYSNKKLINNIRLFFEHYLKK